MEDFNNPFSPTDMIELVTPKDLATFPPASPPFGGLGGAPGFSLYGGLGVPPALGTFSHDAATDTVTLNWPYGDPRLQPFANGTKSMLQALDAVNPGSFTVLNTEDPTKNPFGVASTAHPVGGAVIGKATDFSGRVLGHKKLYVLDGSLIPGGSVGGVNPSLTIAALAERCMDRILETDDEDEQGARDEQ
jgi:cholesterol oxidase